MGKVKNVVRGGVLAVALTALSVIPVFAECSSAQLAEFNLVTGGATATHPVKCGAQLVVDGTKQTVYGKTSADCSKAGALATNPDGCKADDLTDIIKNIINAVIFVVGIIAVVMVILGGIQYSTSQGASDRVKKAKDTIMYGIIGLVVALLAFAIVNFVLGSLL